MKQKQIAKPGSKFFGWLAIVNSTVLAACSLVKMKTSASCFVIEASGS